MISEACRGYRRALLAGGTTDAHGSSCVACAQLRDREHETAALVRAHRPEWTAPIALRERIAAEIERARAKPAPVRRSWARRALLTAAAVSIAAVVAWSLWPRDSGRAPADDLADRLVGDYLEYAQRTDKTQLASASPSELEAWYSHHLDFAATVPRLHGARMLGGRHCKLGDRSAALTFFEVPGEHGAPPTPLSLFVFEPQGEDWSKMEQVASLPGKSKACRHERRGVALLRWQERGLDYVLAGAVDSEQLVELVR